jgi:iron complex transport system permease protein
MSALRPGVAELDLPLFAANTGSRLAAWLAACIAITLLLTAASLLIGTSSLETSLGWLLNPDAQSSVILWQIRLPRTVGAWFAGALLGLAGAIAQGVFRNPLAEPYLLGSASGAALGVTLSLLAADASLGGLAWAGKLGVTGAACIGACAAIALTIMLSRGVLATASLLLAGIVVAFLLSAVTSLLLLSKPDVWRAMQAFLLGSTGFSELVVGGLARRGYASCVVAGRPVVARTRRAQSRRGHGAVAGAVAAGAAFDAAGRAVAGHRDDRRAGRYRRLRRTRRTASGTRDGVGQSSPIVDRRAALRRRLAAGADLVSRWIIHPAELPVGAVTATVGGVYLVVLLWRRNRHE